MCEIICKFFSTMNLLLSEEKKSRDYGTGEDFYHSEINFIDAIYDFPKSNALTLSKKLNVTRGAVSHWGQQLEEKGIIEHYFKKGNKKEKYYSLTALGEKVRLGHKDYHKEANEKICQYLSSLSNDERDLIMDFLEELSKLPISVFECESNCSKIENII